MSREKYYRNIRQNNFPIVAKTRPSGRVLFSFGYSSVRREEVVVREEPGGGRGDDRNHERGVGGRRRAIFRGAHRPSTRVATGYYKAVIGVSYRFC